MSDDQLEQLESQIEYGRVDYPTDHITLKYLRTRFPSRHVDTLAKHGERLDTTHFMERAFVRNGFISASGYPVADADSLLHPEEGHAGAVRDLTADYVYFGLADGPETAKQLIRRLEEAGAELGRQRTGRPSP